MLSLPYTGTPPLDDNEELDYEQFRGLGGPILEDHHQHGGIKDILKYID
jgi:hypothetical protein